MKIDMKVAILKVPTRIRKTVNISKDGLNAAAQFVQIKHIVNVNVAVFLPNLKPKIFLTY